MCSKDGSSPSGTPPGGPPGGSSGGTALCCECDAETDVSRNGHSNYFTVDYSHATSITNKCHIKVERTKKSGTITVKKTFNLTYQAGASASSHQTTVENAIKKAIRAWNSAAGKVKIRIEQPGCEKQKCAVKFEYAIVASSGNVRVRVDNTAAPAAPAAGLRSFVRGGTDMTFYINGVGAIDWTMIHEIGHTYGLPDEYIYNHPNSTAPKTTYKGASDPDKVVTLSTSGIAASAPGTFAFDNDSVMGRNGNTKYPKNLFYWVAIETQKLLAAKGSPSSVYVE